MPHPEIASEATRLRELTPQQWRTGWAAWLGWLFDGLELHLYTLVALPLVVQLLGATSAADPAVKEKTAYIQAAFLIGWAVGGAFFGRLGDRLGRSRALALTVLTYAVFTGLCAIAQTWWQLMLFRFVAALGIGGEWAVGASLLTETWPKSWRPWLAAALQTGVNLGILGAAAIVGLLTLLPHPPSERFVFLVGVLPALLVFWIRRQVPESEAWTQAATSSVERVVPNALTDAAVETRSGIEPHVGDNAFHRRKPTGVADLFRGEIARTTWCTLAVCAFGLSAWWLFAFWHPQHLRRLLIAEGRPAGEITRLVSIAFFAVNTLAIVGNIAAGALAQWLGNRRAILLMMLGLFASMAGAFAVPRTFHELAWFWVPLTGFFSAVFALFTTYLPPLFPTLLRTTGAGFCYNIGRLAAAVASLVFGWYAPVGDFRLALLASSALVLAATIASWWLPDGPCEAQNS